MYHTHILYLVDHDHEFHHPAKYTNKIFRQCVSVQYCSILIIQKYTWILQCNYMYHHNLYLPEKKKNPVLKVTYGT